MMGTMQLFNRKDNKLSTIFIASKHITLLSICTSRNPGFRAEFIIMFNGSKAHSKAVDMKLTRSYSISVVGEHVKITIFLRDAPADLVKTFRYCSQDLYDCTVVLKQRQ